MKFQFVRGKEKKEALVGGLVCAFHPSLDYSILGKARMARYLSTWTQLQRHGINDFFLLPPSAGNTAYRRHALILAFAISIEIA